MEELRRQLAEVSVELEETRGKKSLISISLIIDLKVSVAKLFLCRIVQKENSFPTEGHGILL